MLLHRTAERAARAVYGTIIALAVIATLSDGSAAAGEVLVAVIGGVVAAQLAELYASYLADVIREQRYPSRARMRAALVDSAAGSVAAVLPAVPFVVAAIGA
ncbi:MAG: hypothetical protein ABWZ03_07080, partial [Solirubrobacterales bacterium]